jgi:hypothetical protein|tara:strand:- start:227 stop:349 length:123 start_codon:yes stop_codon:yes gene_type:complete
MFNGKNIREYGIIAEIYTGCRGIMGRRVRSFMQDLILRKS